MVRDERSSQVERETVAVERRVVLKSSLALFAAAIPPSSWSRKATSQATDLACADDQKAAWDKFVEQLMPMARDVVGSPIPDEDWYLKRTDELLGRLACAPPADFTSGLELDSVYTLAALPLAAVQFKFAPWARIPHHDHRHHVGISKVLQGRVRVLSFDLIEQVEAGAGKTFAIRQVEDRILGPGDRTSLSRTRRNIHTLIAQEEGALVLDIFTYFRSDARSVYIEVKDNHLEGGKCVYLAQWKER
jgi:PCO_ADO